MRTCSLQEDLVVSGFENWFGEKTNGGDDFPCIFVGFLSWQNSTFMSHRSPEQSQ